jgi:hypothetical protein
MNDFAGLTPTLLAGGGIGDLPPIVQPDLVRDGQLVEVMPDWHFRTFDLSLAHLGTIFQNLAVSLRSSLRKRPRSYSLIYRLEVSTATGKGRLEAFTDGVVAICQLVL